MDWGRRVYGVAAVGIGVVALANGGPAGPWQPIPDALPAREALGYLAGALFVALGLALQLQRTARWAGVGLSLLYVFFCIQWVVRVVAMPGVIGTWLGVAEELALALGGLSAAALLGLGADSRLAAPGSRLAATAFGLFELVFGASHLLALKETAAMTPAWLPPGPQAWAILTGLAHLAAGLGLISGVKDRLAAQLLAVMFAVFGALVWAPMTVAKPRDPTMWAGDFVNLALLGAAWTLADYLGSRAPRPASRTSALEPVGATETPKG